MASGSSKNLRVLIADDDPEHLRLMKLAVVAERPLWDIRTVCTGDQFSDAMVKYNFDCAVIDYNLRDYTAETLVEALHELNNNCPVLVVSSNENQQVVISCLRSGCADFIPKSQAFAPMVLIKRIEYAVEQSVLKCDEKRHLERRHLELIRQTETDELTGLCNRRFLAKKLEGFHFQCDRRREIAVIMLDIDHFKAINDHYGHQAGDAVLTKASEMIKSQLGGGDIAVRWGGEEFLVLLGSRDMTYAWAWADKLREKISRKVFTVDGKDISFTISAGIITIPTWEMSHEMVDIADHVMYLAKRAGRNRCSTLTMLMIDKLIQQSCAECSGDIEDIWDCFIGNSAGFFTCTQKAHVIEHGLKVSEIVALLAGNMGFGDERIRRLKIAGRMHDVGKTIIPEKILKQCSPLNADQWRFISRHPEFGAEIVHRLGGEPGLVEIVRLHHCPFEFDIANKELAEDVRLISAADSYAAMTTDRSYRAAMSPKQAFAELALRSGSQYDPSVVRAFGVDNGRALVNV